MPEIIFSEIRNVFVIALRAGNVYDKNVKF